MQVCPRCQRANPDEAIFCYQDGTDLRPVPGRPTKPLAPNELPHAFVFPTGRSCATYDELVKACQEDWPGARELLRQGVFAQFLSTIGRADLSRLAAGAATQPDPDLGLTTFLAGLPTTRPRTPRLELFPRRLLVGTLRVGEARQVRLTVSNHGQGILHGTLSLGGDRTAEWVRLADDPAGTGQCLIKTANEQPVILEVDARGLPAGQKYAAKLTVITNGGAAEVPVRMEVAGLPFPWPPFQGAGSPREMAERMRKRPKDAVEFLESGEIARWFLGNGWPYPVQEPLAKGVAAVQQFFEGMGLSRVPPLYVSEPDVRMTPVYPEAIRWQVTLYTDVKKWVYGWVESDVPWLKVLTPEVSGPQQAAVAFEADSSLLEPNRIYAGQVHIRGNGGQALTVNVVADVQEGGGYYGGHYFPAFSGTLALVMGWLVG